LCRLWGTQAEMYALRHYATCGRDKIEVRLPAARQCRVERVALRSFATQPAIPVSHLANYPSGSALENGGDTLPATNAHGFKPKLHFTPVHLMRHIGQDAPARCADGMAQ